MVAGFRRSASLSGPARAASPPEKSYHVRSASLPCRSHPLISQLEGEVRATRAWQSPAYSAQPGAPPNPAELRSGLVRLELLHLALDDLLQLPQTRDSLRRRTSGLAERLLDDFLLFADAYGSFWAALVAVKDLQAAAQVAARRGDEAGLASAARSLRKAEKEMADLASALPDVPRSAEAALAAASSGNSAGDAELAGVLRAVEAVTVSVSAAVFRGTAEALSFATAAVAPPRSTASWAALRRLASSPSLKKKRTEEEEWARRAVERLTSLEDCLVGMEGESERVFRGLINTRVSLLNILTP